jgi:aminoglycoside phosphotransferase (APT) family kinase protein
MAIELTQSTQVGPALLAYLAQRLDVSDLSFAEEPEQVTHGWETYIYTFRLAGAGLEPGWARPLILRIYPGEDQAQKAEGEAAIQRFAAERGYPAPLPLAVEATNDALGRPFMIMERVPGIPMRDRMAGNLATVPRAAALMADAHVALHRLPVDGCTIPSDGLLVDRQFPLISLMLVYLGVELPKDAEEPLAWLKAHKGMVVPEEVSLCHHDFHPLNIMVDDDNRVSVLDWSQAALGDRHSDLARSVVLLRMGILEQESPRLLKRLMTRFRSGPFVWLYLRRYRQQLPIDPERLRYWEAMHAFWMLVSAFAARSVDPSTTGMKPDTASRIPPGSRERLLRYFWRKARP